MADLNQLCDALEVIRQNRKTAKVFFYFVSKNDGRMLSGFFSISEGKSCCIHYLNKSNENALAEIPHLSLTKIMSLPASPMDFSNQSFPPCELNEILSRLNSTSIQRTMSVGEPCPSIEQKDSEMSKPKYLLPPYSHFAMQEDAINLLESVYGPSATQRVQEIALALPPQQYPTEFLDKCKLHASLVLGPKMANAIFRPIYEKHSHACISSR